MGHKFLKLLGERISGGLMEKSIRTCSDWALMYRIMGQPFPGAWTFERHPWVKQIMDDENPEICCQKSAQMGYTEAAINKTFFNIDYKGISVMYFLPASKPDATDFSTGRFDPALELSPHLKNLFSDTSNIGHKRAGTANLYIRGARSRSQAKSVPCGMMVFDEIDEMNPNIVTLALERMSGHINKQCFKISTPTIEKFGVNAAYIISDRKEYFFKCPHCNKMTQLTFPECLVITSDDYTDAKIFDSYLICKECKGILGHDSKPEWLANGEWVPAHPKRISSGYHINQLYSIPFAPHEIAIGYLKSIADLASEQEFYNSKLGIPHTVEGARVTAEDIDECMSNYKMMEVSPSRSIVTMGVDVGKYLHYEIIKWTFINDNSSHDINLMARAQVIKVGKIEQFEQLDNLMRNFYVRFAVIDAQPETRKSLEFARRFPGHVQCCWYGKGIKAKQINQGTSEPEYITVDRTSWLDMSLGRFRNHTIILPLDIPTEYKEQIKAPVRIYEKDKSGNPIGRYVKGVHDMDHYAHAHNYTEIALPLCMAFAQTQNIGDIY